MDALAPSETTLDRRLEAGPLHPEVVARIGFHACRALAITPPGPRARRDFSPAEILLVPSEGGEVTVDVAAIEGGAGRSPMYLSPEQATHASPPDARSEVYSLSVILYEALSGALPLPRCDTEGELLTALVTHDPRPLEAAAPWVEPALARVIERGLLREPARRWASPGDLGEALLPFTGATKRITAKALARPAPARRPAPVPAPIPGSRFLGVGLVAAVLASLFPVVLGGLWLVNRSQREVKTLPPIEILRAVSGAESPAKKAKALALLEEKSFFIHLDPRRPGVVVPAKFQAQPELVLQVGRDMALPIPDLAVGDAGITGTLSFSHEPFAVTIPWSAVFALRGEDGRSQVWNEDVPAEVLAAEAAKKQGAPEDPPR